MYNVLKHRKNDEIKTKSKFTATALKPHRNRKVRQFKKDQYCTKESHLDQNVCILHSSREWRAKG